MDKDQITTTIVLDRECWELLRRLATLRAAEAGGRPNASGLEAREGSGASGITLMSPQASQATFWPASPSPTWMILLQLSHAFRITNTLPDLP